MSSRTQREFIILTEGILNPKSWARAAGNVAKSFVPNNVRRDLGLVKKGISGNKPKSNVPTKANAARSASPAQPKAPKPPAVKMENEHKYINNYLVRNKLKSTKLSSMPTLAPGKSSGRFGIVDSTGRPKLMFYPFAPVEDPKSQDNDTGFVVYDAATRKMKVVDQPLAQSGYPEQEGFITLENSPSKVPHTVR